MIGVGGMVDAILTASIDAMIVTDGRGRIEAFNPAAEAMFGCTRATVLGRALCDVIAPPEVRSIGVERLRNHLQGPPPARGERLEVEAARADGTVFPANLAGAEVEGADGPRTAFCLRDLTAIGAPIARTQQGEARLKSFVDHAPVGMFVRRLSGEYEMVNATMLASLGQRAEDAIGRPFGDVAGEDVIAESLATERIILETGEPHVAEVVYPTITGAREMMSIRFPIRDIEGTITHIGGVIVDIAGIKSTEARLRETEARLSSFMNHAPVGMYVTALDGRYQMVNAAILDSLGMSAEQVIDRPYWDVLGAEHRMEGEATKQRVIETGRPQVGEAAFPSTRGMRETLIVRFPLRDVDGRVVQIGGVVVDITDQRLTEARLRESEARLAAFMQHAPASMFLKDEAGRYLLVNEDAAAHMGLQPADMLGRTVREIGFPGLADFTDRVERMVRDTGKAITGVQTFNLATGLTHALATRFPVPDAEGRLTQLGGVLIDVTERREAEQRLRESERRFRLLSELHPVPVTFMRLRDRKVVLANPAFHAMIGSPGSDLACIPAVNCLFDDAERDRVHAHLNATESSDNLEWHMRRCDGTAFWAAVSSRRIDLDGETVVVSSFIDLTDRKLAEAELERSREALFQSEKLTALGSMLAGVSHELNNPLAVVVGQSIILEEDAAGTPFERTAGAVRRAAERCSRIVQTFLAMARQKRPEHQAVVAAEILDAALELAAYGLRTGGVTVIRHYHPALPPVWADKDQLHQVLMNLLVNAQQALQEVQGERMLVLRAYAAAPGFVALEVADNGPGVPAEVARRIFEPFYTTKPLGVGTGIGLSFSRGVMEAHGGSLSLVPSASGATFRIEVPVARDAAAAAAPGTWQPAALVPETRPRALIVDDELELAQTLAEFVAREGYTTEIALGGLAAQGMLRSTTYDVILSDVRMPDLDGPGLFAWLGRARPDLVDRIAFVTGDTLGPAAARFLEEAGRPRLDKPFGRDGVRALLRALRRL